MTREDLEIAKKIIQLEEEVNQIELALKSEDLKLSSEDDSLIGSINYKISQETLKRMLYKERQKLKDDIQHLFLQGSK